MDYKEIADQIIIAIGGQDNVKYVTHCVTRLRFVLKNKNGTFYSIIEND